MTLAEMREKALELLTASRQIIDRANDENRNLTPEEQVEYDRMQTDYDDFEERINRQIALEEREFNASRPATEPVERANPTDNPETPSVDESEQRARDRFGSTWDELPRAIREQYVARSTPEYHRAFDAALRHGMHRIGSDEHRALSAGTDASGGFLTVPEQFMAELIKGVDDAVYIRQMATVIQVPTAQSLGVPSLETDVSDANWTSEILTGTEDSSMAFGKRALYPHPLAKLIKVSNKLMRMAVMSADKLVRDRLAYKFGIVEESAFLTGTGVNQPLGLFTASDDGISTSRDVSTGNSTTAIAGDGLIEAKYSLKPQHQANASWMFHRDAMKNIRKLKDGNGQYIYQPGLAADRPSTILDLPYVLSEYVPNTFTTGLYVGMVGDFSFYWIADALDMAIQVLDQLYAETNQIGYIGRLECDAMPVLEEAFARVTLA